MNAHGPLGATPPSGSFDLTPHVRPARDAKSRRRRVAASRTLAAQLGIAGVLVTGLVISIAAAGTNILLPESVRPVPSWLAGPFGSTGLDLHGAGVVVVLTLMFVSYVLVARSADRLSPRVILMSIAALHALVLLAPPLLSTDIFSYAAYGRMGALYGASPYLHGPNAIALDPLFPFVGAKWSYTPTVYGPLFTALSYVLAPLSIAAGTLAYKSIAAIASLATVALVWNAARLRGVNPAKAAAVVGLNPLIVVYGVGGGHNDLLMLVAMIAGLYMVLQHRGRAGGGLMSMAIGIKLTAGLLLPFAFFGGEPRGVSSRRRDLLITAALTAVALAALGLLLFGTGLLHMFATLKQTQNEGDWHSIPGFLFELVGIGAVSNAVGLALGAVFAGVFGWLVWQVRNGMDWIQGAGWATLALLLTASAMLPWYVAWLMPLAALGGDRRLWRAAIIMTGVVIGIQIIGYIPNAPATLGL